MVSDDVTRKPSLFFKIIGSVIFFCIGVFVKSYFFNENEKNNEEIIAQKLEIANKMLPVVSEDGFLRTDTFFKLEDGGFKYSHTLLEEDEKTPKVYIDALKYKLKEQFQNRYDTSANLKPLRELGVKLNHQFNDKNGYYLFDFTIRPTKKE